MLTARQPRNQHGMTLIEVMVAMVILSGGILAMAASQAAAMKYTKVAQFKGVAVQVANDLIDRMRANQAGNYTFTAGYSANDTTPIPVPDCTTGPCNAQTIADFDLAQIRTRLRTALPGGGLRVDADGNAIEIFVIWETPEAPGSDPDNTSAILRCPGEVGGSSATQCLSMRVVP